MFKKRRMDLFSRIFLDEKLEKNHNFKKAVLILFAGFEDFKYEFRQESSFYYFTGIVEPAVAMAVYFDKEEEKQILEVLYIPDYGDEREMWMSSGLSLENGKGIEHLKIDKVKKLGDLHVGYSYSPKFTQSKYSNLISDINNFVDEQTKIFTLLDKTGFRYFYQTEILNGICQILPDLRSRLVNISEIVDEMRVVKQKEELVLIREAIKITTFAYGDFCRRIKAGTIENEIKAVVNSTYIKMFARPAFPTIAATGGNTTVLHYDYGDSTLKDGDLFLIDSGAEYKYYSADLTRTYPVSGKFSKRQAAVYEVVLRAQEYIERLSRPGMFLNNANKPKKSLHHLAVKFFERYGYSRYFCHGIGHFLGLDVHDVASYNGPLVVGSVFTIEPGIYLPREGFGIRIEDDYLMTENGALCLSCFMPKTIVDIENLLN